MHNPDGKVTGLTPGRPLAPLLFGPCMAMLEAAARFVAVRQY
jgi:hypothetical protein